VFQSSGKDPRFVWLDDECSNGGPPPLYLGASRITPRSLFFVRNHGEVPQIDPSRYRLVVDGLVERCLRLSLAGLRRRLEPVAVEAALVCAGLRRQELEAVAPLPGQLRWGEQAAGNAVWSGWSLADVIGLAGPLPEAAHVCFQGHDTSLRRGKVLRFGGSVPLDKAQSLEVLLATDMNGEPLSPLHGFPLRVIVPGHFGARSVKWLKRITLSAQPSDSHFQRRDYRLLPSGATPGDELGEMLGELAVNTVICHPRAGQRLPEGELLVSGFAISGNGRRISRVQVSVDGGLTWQEAELEIPFSRWAWTRFRAEVQVGPGPLEVMARSIDEQGHGQPSTLAEVWNPLGYANNSWARVSCAVMASAGAAAATG
jgi:sulfite oxidase